jgi:hypothetical protein
MLYESVMGNDEYQPGVNRFVDEVALSFPARVDGKRMVKPQQALSEAMDKLSQRRQYFDYERKKSLVDSGYKDNMTWAIKQITRKG